MRHGAGEDGKVVAVIGDGAMTGGVAFEAVHQAGGLGTPIVVILNDNGMSIAPNVGALSRYFNRVRLDPGLWKAREGVEEKLDAAAGRHRRRASSASARSSRSRSRRSGSPGLWWEELDWAYMGVIDGHDVRAAAPRAARRLRGRAAGRRSTSPRSRARASRPPRTAAWRAWRSGTPPSRSRSPAAAGPRPPSPRRAPPPPQYTQVFGEAHGARVRARRARGRHHRRDELRHRALDPPEGDARPLLRRRHRRAAGRAVRGRPRAAGHARPWRRSTRPSCSARSTRSSTTSACRTCNVTFCMDRAGLVGDDGPTHHGVFDIAYLRSLPNITLMAPRDEAMLVAHAPHRAAASTARRRSATRAARPSASPIPADAARCSRSAPARSCARASGWRSSATAPASARRSAPPTCWPSAGSTSPSPTRASPSRSTPALLAQLAAEHDLLVTVEEGVLMGGFGSARLGVAVATAALAPRILRVGLPDRYVTHGAPKLLHEEVGFTAERIAERIEAAVLDPRGSLVWHAARYGASSAAATRPATLMSTVKSITVTLLRPCPGSGSTACWRSAACSRPARARPPRCWPATCTWARAGAGGQAGPARGRRRRARRSTPPPPYVSRGGVKLANALDALGLDGRGAARARRRRLDRRLHRLPAPARRRRTWWRSTWPTASCDWRLRGDARVTVIERTNARVARAGDAAVRAGPDRRRRLVHLADEGAARRCWRCAAERFDCLAMVKPQFEVGRGRVGKGGVVRDPALRREAIGAVAAGARAGGASVLGFASSGLPGPGGQPGDVRVARPRAAGGASRTSRPRCAEVEV